MSAVAQRLTDRSVKIADLDPITDSDSGGEEEYVVRPVPKDPAGDSQNNKLTLLSTAYNRSDKEDTDIKNN